MAETRRGVIINADASQCYRDLRILSARPSPAETARAPHRLVLGMPTEGVVSGGHIRYHAHQHGVTIHDSLEATVAAAVAATLLG